MVDLRITSCRPPELGFETNSPWRRGRSQYRSCLAANHHPPVPRFIGYGAPVPPSNATEWERMRTARNPGDASCFAARTRQ
jgi:hypothetical protein